jgi:hypothetical protein
MLSPGNSPAWPVNATAREVNQPLAAIAANAEASLRLLTRPKPDVREAIEGVRFGAIDQRLRAIRPRRDAACSWSLRNRALIGDKACDADPLLDTLNLRNITVVIPPKANPGLRLRALLQT